MVYYDGHDLGRRLFRPIEQNGGFVWTPPDDATRRRIEEAVWQFPRWGPAMIADELRFTGAEVPIDVIRTARVQGRHEGERLVNSSHRPEPMDGGERDTPGAITCRACGHLVAHDEPLYRVTATGIKPCAGRQWPDTTTIIRAEAPSW